MSNMVNPEDVFLSSISTNPEVIKNVELQNKALSLHQAGQDEQEELTLLNVLKRKILTSGNGSQTVALTKNSLAELYIKMGRLDEAQKLLEEAETVRKMGNLSDLACTRDNLGRVFEMRGDYERAIKWRKMGAPNAMVCSHFECPKMTQTFELSKYANLSHCARCKCVFYCSSVCQKKDWNRHKKYCKAPAPAV
ncbi:hypothetical protein DFH28DRAFT_1065406 [Melampsora americana]|nr:hypothetical protein DFH28DRAFT_1065406 [Melampsora americana]